MAPDIFNNLPAVEVIKGFHGKFIHTPLSTLAYWHIEAGSVLPQHAHIHEQCTWVLEGELEMTVNGEVKACGPGSFMVIPADVPHGGRALTDCKVFDIFCPVREDYKSLTSG